MIGVALLPALCGVARADRLTDVPEAPPTITMTERLTENFTLLGNELGLHINTVTFDVVDMEFDVRNRAAKLRLGGGDGRFSLRVDGDILFRSGYARVRARLDLGIAGKNFSIALPEFDMVPRSYGGESYVEVRIPLIQGRF